MIDARKMAMVLVLMALGAGGVFLVSAIRPRVAQRWRAQARHVPARLRSLRRERAPNSRLPGPPRQDSEAWRWRLDEGNSRKMQGHDNPYLERWRDAAGHRYSEAFISSFRYEGGGGLPAPEVRVQVDPVGPTFSGRIEARGLKPNFAYQVKLNGNFEDRQSFEAIGYAGRWRLPGAGTNYSDADYEGHPNPAAVEAYILFDYFVTDARGDAVRHFALDSSLHVLWQAAQRAADRSGDVVAVTVEANDPEFYARPRRRPVEIRLWAERAHARYRRAEQRIALAPGVYRAELALTEESFHDRDAQGGRWATVATLPVAFTVENVAAEGRLGGSLDEYGRPAFERTLRHGTR